MVWGRNIRLKNIGWSGSWISGAYNQYATATRPYMFGWVGFGVGWPYADKAEIGLRSSWLKERLTLDFSFYSNRDKDLLVKIPVAHEFGYTGQYKQRYGDYEPRSGTVSFRKVG